MKIALAAFCAVAFACPAFAQDKPVCEYYMDDVISTFATQGVAVTMIPEADIPGIVADVEALTGTDYGDVTRAFIVQSGGSILLGLEEGGCLLPPINVANAQVPAKDTLSGKTDLGIFA